MTTEPTSFSLKIAVSTVLSLALSSVGCTGAKKDAGIDPLEREYISAAPQEEAPVDEVERQRLACEEKLIEVLKEPAVPGAPAFDRRRAQLLASAKAEPVLFTNTPEYAETESLEVKGFREMLGRSPNPWATVQRILVVMKGRPYAARATLLKDGYLYSDNPDLAFALVSLVQPDDLFGHDEIWITRGDRTERAVRKRGKYYYAEGPLEGERVRLLHLDRIGPERPSDVLHRDVRSLAHRLGFDRMKVRHVSNKHIVANLRYGSWWVPTVLESYGARLERICEVVAPNLRLEVDEARAQTRRRNRVVQGLRKAILEQIDEGLPFDEPHHEYGHQLDGKLRRNWFYAYMSNRSYYAFNGDRYFVFNRNGRPLTPQVCVDFLTDTLERTSGTRYRGNGDEPGRTVGKLDFDAIEDIDRTELRRVPHFVDFARTRSDWFDVYDVSARETYIYMGKEERFYPYLEDNADHFAPGDILVIRGKTPWDPNRAHYHSFFVYESDPITGIPIIVAGNAGKPSLRSWETEARRTPKRSIRHRLRPKTEWLEQVLSAPPPSELLPLAKGRG